MSLSLPIPYAGIADAIKIQGVTAEQIDAVKAEQAPGATAKAAFKAADLGLTPGKLGQLRRAVRAYGAAVEKLQETPDDIDSLITIGALEDASPWNSWKPYYAEKTLSSMFELEAPSVEMNARQSCEVLNVMRAYGFKRNTKSWAHFIKDLVDPDYKKSALTILQRLGDFASEAKNLNDGGHDLLDIARQLYIADEKYAAWAVILGERLDVAYDPIDLEPTDRGVITAFQRRFTVPMNDRLAAQIYTAEGLTNFQADPNRCAYHSLRHGTPIQKI